MTTKREPARKLTLDRTTLRTLDRKDLGKVAGGWLPDTRDRGTVSK